MRELSNTEVMLTAGGYGNVLPNEVMWLLGTLVVASAIVIGAIGFGGLAALKKGYDSLKNYTSVAEAI